MSKSIFGLGTAFYVGLVIALLCTPAYAQGSESTPEKISIEFLGRVVVASRNCGEDTTFSPQVTSVYIQKYAQQEAISFEKAKYMAISEGDKTLFDLISSGKKDEFCLKVIR